MKSVSILIVLMTLSYACQEPVKSDKSMIAVGTYTKKEGHVDGKANGIYLVEMDNQSGQLQIIETIENVVNPSYLTVDNRSVYAVNELADNSEGPIGTLTKINLDQTDDRVTINVGGNAPCHITISPDHNYAIASNYMGAISLIDISERPVLLGVTHPQGEVVGPPRQESPHPHMSIYAPDNTTILVSDLGLDQIIHYTIKESQLIELTRTSVTSGAGPRHIAIDKNNSTIYVLNELNHSIEAFKWEGAKQPMTPIQTISTLADGIRNININCSAIKIHPSLPLLYAANRGINGDAEQSISAFKIDSDGVLSRIGQYPSKGLIPRDFAISPNGKFLLAANQNSDNIVVYTIEEDGVLTDTGFELNIKTPVCLKYF